jgi:ribose 1,5-bisphosphokinase
MRTSCFQSVPLNGDVKSLTDLLGRAIGVQTIVSKQRETYSVESALMNLDDVAELGHFVKIAVDVEHCGGPAEALRLTERLKTMFCISEADIVSWPYGDLLQMTQAAAKWREKLQRAERPGRLFLLDGASCTGKTTLAHRLAERPELRLDFAPRYTTRRPRGEAEPEYIFVSPEEFNRLAGSGVFIEYRDFDFGMSYGLPWNEVVTPLLSGRNVMGIIDLGNVRHVKRWLPEAVTILITASEATIRERLLRRGHNTPHEINERLENARRVSHYASFYDFIVSNDEDMLEAAVERIVGIVRGAA